jgi:hypothetical protein
VANKCELSNQKIDNARAQQFADANGLFLMQASAKESYRVEELFDTLTEGLMVKL